MVTKFGAVPLVVGAELRNEPRSTVVGGKALNPTWGNSSEATDWNMAAERCGAAVQKLNSDLLIIVDGNDYATHLQGVQQYPVRLPVANKVVYVAHDYSWFHNSEHTYEQLSAKLEGNWGYLITNNTAPVWVSEFGISNDGTSLDSGWWPLFTRYLKERELSWSYWRVDGTESNATSRTFNKQTGFGIMNTTWNGAVHDGALLKSLQALLHTGHELKF